MEIIKKNWLIILLAVIIAGGSFLWIFYSNKNAYDENRSKNLIKIYNATGNPEKYPIMWQDGNRIVGAGSDLVQKVFSNLGINLMIKYSGAWDEVQEKVKNGEIDVLVGIYKNSKQAEYLEYSDFYATDKISLFVKKGKYIRFNRKEDLVGKKGIAISSDSFGQEFDDFSAWKLNIKKVETSDEAFEEIQDGTADYFIRSDYLGKKMVAEKNLSDKIVVVPKSVASENFYVAISKKSPLVQYLPKVNSLIEKYKNDGTIDKMLEENLAKTISDFK